MSYGYFCSIGASYKPEVLTLQPKQHKTQTKPHLRELMYITWSNWMCLCSLQHISVQYMTACWWMMISTMMTMMTSSNGTFSALLALCAGNSPVTGEFPAKGQWRGTLIFSLICARISGWVNNREAGDLRRHRAHYDVIVMFLQSLGLEALQYQIFWPLASGLRHRSNILFDYFIHRG